jgi:hypothetical protein
MGAAGAARAGDACVRTGGHGVWAFACSGAACTLRPTTVTVMDQDGTHDDRAFGFSLLVEPPSKIQVQPPAGAAADLLQVSATAGVIAELAAEADGGFAVRKPDAVMALVDALGAGKRLLLVFTDKTRAVNAAVAAISHDGFAATLKDAFAAADAAAAANGDATCPP